MRLAASHTHGLGLIVTDWVWKEGATVLGTGELTQLSLPIGVHNVALTITDSGNNDSTEPTTITILPFGYPDVESISPVSGSVAGGYELTISGTGFSFASSELIVHFGLTDLTGSDILVVDATTIKVAVPYQAVAVPVQLSVESISLNATSNSMTFTYETAVPIKWTSALITYFPSVTVAAFSPVGTLYAANSQGHIARIVFDDNFNIVDSVVALVVPDRAILGMAFDPMTSADTPDPWVYFSSSKLFHGGSQSSSGNAINGKIQRARGANLEIVEDIVTGLPVADMDHGTPTDLLYGWILLVIKYLLTLPLVLSGLAVNGIDFGNKGELYIQIGR